MNNNLINWQENLYFKLESSKICDLNRLIYLHCPSTTRIKQNSSTVVSSRKKEIYDLSMYFSRTLKEGGSISQLLNLFYTSLNYIRWVDANNEVAFTEISINGYCKMLIERAYRNEIKRTTYVKIRSHLSSVLSAINIPTNYVNLTQSLPKNDGEPFEAYSRSDLKKLLPLLRSLFNQTSKQFIENPDIHMSSHPTAHTMTFEYNGEIHKLRSGTTKMICAAAFLMAFYTYANTSLILQLKRPQKEKIENGEEWYSMPSFKRRSFKTITLEIGEHKLSTPKYSISFFNTLLKVSKIIDNSIDARLLSIPSNNKIRKLQNYNLQTFNKLWLEPIFKLKDERNRQLRASISRFRKTGSNFTSQFQGEIEQGILLDNTPDVRRKHYSSGNNYENISMMQDVTLIRQERRFSS